MVLQITGKNLDIGQALRAYVTERIEHKLEKYIGDNLIGHIRIEKIHGEFRTDCSLQLRSGISLQSHGKSHDAYTSADAAFDRLEKRLRRYKRRLKDHHSQPSTQDHVTQALDYVIEHSDEELQDQDGLNPIVIAEMQTTIRPYSVSDAVMVLDLSDDPVLVFRNAGHGRINVVYRRSDGNIGWIDPESAVADTGPDG